MLQSYSFYFYWNPHTWKRRFRHQNHPLLQLERKSWHIYQNKVQHWWPSKMMVCHAAYCVYLIPWPRTHGFVMIPESPPKWYYQSWRIIALAHGLYTYTYWRHSNIKQPSVFIWQEIRFEASQKTTISHRVLVVLMGDIEIPESS